ncbi:MAG: diaminopimelate epimerase [Vampirovibrionales bacterium]
MALLNVPFVKMHGLGNDFVMMKASDLPTVELEALSRLAKIVCDRHYGIGGDGLIVAAPPTESGFDTRFIYLNGDGSVAEMCGNGIRCFARYVKQQGLLNTSTFKVQTLAGLIQPELLSDGQVRVNMGTPILAASEVPFNQPQYHASTRQPARLTLNEHTLNVWPISMGNPHCIVFSDENPALDPVVYGPHLETHPLFTAKTNVEFTSQTGESTFKVVVWERGCGFTLACGTGACATGVAALLSGRAKGDTVFIDLPGGRLTIEWGGQAAHPVFMTGPAEVVFTGYLNEAWLTQALVSN